MVDIVAVVVCGGRHLSLLNEITSQTHFEVSKNIMDRLIVNNGRVNNGGSIMEGHNYM